MTEEAAASSPWFSFLGCPVRRPCIWDAFWVIGVGVLLGMGMTWWATQGGPDRVTGLAWAGALAIAVGLHRLGLPFRGACTFRATSLWLLLSGGWWGGVVGAHALGWC
jgi:hypothetical protein